MLDIPLIDSKQIIKEACKAHGKHKIITETEDYSYLVFMTL